MGLNALRLKLLRSLDALKCARYPQQDTAFRDAHLLVLLQEALCSGHDRFCMDSSGPQSSIELFSGKEAALQALKLVK